MTLEEFRALLSEIGIKVVYQDIQKQQAPPYIAYFEEDAETITANGIVVAVVHDVEVHLITEARDANLEEQLESKLEQAGLVWERSLNYDSKQGIFDIVYSISLVTGKD